MWCGRYMHFPLFLLYGSTPEPARFALAGLKGTPESGGTKLSGAVIATRLLAVAATTIAATIRLGRGCCRFGFGRLNRLDLSAGLALIGLMLHFDASLTTHPLIRIDACGVRSEEHTSELQSHVNL